jgi:formylglycine-generating enzyme
MKRILTGLFLVAGLAGGCSGSRGAPSAGDASSDAATPDSSMSCGRSGELCCRAGTACKTGLACRKGKCASSDDLDGAADSSRDAREEQGSDSGEEDADSSDEVDSGPPIQRSCLTGDAGIASCGASSESCCTSVEIPGSEYFRTYDLNSVNDAGIPNLSADGGPTGEADRATISTFRLDKYDVTVGRFRQFVSAWNGGMGYLPPAGSGKHTYLNGGKGLTDSANPGHYETGWLASDNTNIDLTDGNLACDPNYATWTTSAGSNETMPMVCANWYESFAFCIWDGGFLPSEAEWEFAAAGGNEQREYPWGAADPGTANQYAIYNCYYDGSGPGSCAGAMNIAPVGTATMGAGRWGNLDLAGNVWQWNLDWFAGYVDPCDNCASVTEGSDKVVRGGYFDGMASSMISSFRSEYAGSPAYRHYFIGLRCARQP